VLIYEGLASELILIEQSLIRWNYENAYTYYKNGGGTIEFFDPAYEEINKKLMKLDATIDSYLKNLIKPHFDYSAEEVTQKDSRDINQEDREKLIAAIEGTSHQNIIVTHGTFTMAETAKIVADALTGVKKKIIFTGSMIPIAGFNVSDAGFNLGFVAGSFDGLSAGVYLSMNGGVFPPNEAEKNLDSFRFE